MAQFGTSFAGVVAAAVFASIVAFPTSAHATEPDAWVGKDKALHFATDGTIAAGGYALGAVLFDSRTKALVLGGTLAAVAGIGKELVDLTGLGDPSWKDLAWDGIGLVAGLATALSVDLALRSPGAEKGLRVMPSIDQRTAGLQARLTW